VKETRLNANQLWTYVFKKWLTRTIKKKTSFETVGIPDRLISWKIPKTAKVHVDTDYINP
jgi:hypothetical protein